MEKYIQIQGRKTIHHSACSYLKNGMAHVTEINAEEIETPLQFCSRCCKAEKEKREEYYVILDLEMCRVKRNKFFHYKQEIIQIGAVKVNRNFEMISEFSTFVRPQYGDLDFFISHMTGIRESQLHSAPYFDEALKQFLQWMGNKVTRLYAWSDSDYNQFLHELKGKQMLTDENLALLDMNWIDYQKSFIERYSLGRHPSLEEALNLAEIIPEGSYHNGLDDAANTAKLVQKIEMNPDYQLAKEFVVEKTAEKQNEILSYSLGDKFSAIFSGLKLA